MMMVPEPSPEGEAQATESIGDDLKIPKANGFAKGKTITWQTFAANSNGKCRWWNHQNI
jgi:hypothetical protein